jgi:hypothetical protein
MREIIHEIDNIFTVFLGYDHGSVGVDTDFRKISILKIMTIHNKTISFLQKVWWTIRGPVLGAIPDKLRTPVISVVNSRRKSIVDKVREFPNTEVVQRVLAFSSI